MRKKQRKNIPRATGQLQKGAINTCNGTTREREKSRIFEAMNVVELGAPSWTQRHPSRHTACILIFLPVGIQLVDTEKQNLLRGKKIVHT